MTLHESKEEFVRTSTQEAVIMSSNQRHKTKTTMVKTCCDDEESGSKSSSDATSHSSSDWNMTEEEAMEIWLRRNEEIGERVRRRDAARSSIRPYGEEQQSPPSSLSKEGSTSSGLHGKCDDSLGSWGSGSLHAAATTHSDAWKSAVSRNVMGEFDPHNTDPTYQNSYHAYQRFVDTNQPGMADNYVASTPGLAVLMEQRRHLIARQRHFDLQLQQMQTSDRVSSCQSDNSGQGGDSRMMSHSSPLHQNLDNTARAKELRAGYGDPPRYVTSNPTHASAAASAQAPDNKNLSYTHSKVESVQSSTKDPTSIQNTGYFYAFTYPTSSNCKAVTCTRCREQVYTTPLAVNMFCQSCGRISAVEEDLESRWEGKMQDAEDMDIGY